MEARKQGLTYCLRQLFVGQQLTVKFDQYTREVIAATLGKMNMQGDKHFATDWKLSRESVLITRTR